MLMKLLGRRKLDLFQFLEDVSCLFQETSSVLTDWSRRVLNCVWECPYSVVKQLSGSRVVDPTGLQVGHYGEVSPGVNVCQTVEGTSTAL